MRNGKLALEHYFRGFGLKAAGGPGIIDFNLTTTRDLRSMTNSVTALLLGIVLDRGVIIDVDQSVLSFSGQRRSSYTREGPYHHSTPADDVNGLDWNDDASYTNEDTLNRSLDPYRYVLSLPVVEPAGSVWNYSGGATALIAGVLGRATGRRFNALAATLLFDPWASQIVALDMAPERRAKELVLPLDAAAKIGQLVLNRGRWNGTQVVSERCVNAAPRRRSRRSTAASITVFNSGLACHSGDRGQLLRQ